MIFVVYSSPPNHPNGGLWRITSFRSDSLYIEIIQNLQGPNSLLLWRRAGDEALSTSKKDYSSFQIRSQFPVHDRNKQSFLQVMSAILI